MSMFAWNSNIDTSPSHAANPSVHAQAQHQQQQQQRQLRWLPPNLVRSSNTSPTSSSPTMTTVRQPPQLGDNSTLSGSNDPSLAEIAVPATQISGPVDAGQQKPVEQRRRGRPSVSSSQTGMEKHPPVTAAQIATATAAAAGITRANSANNKNTTSTTTPNGKKRGRLLTIAEETCLFQICNRHASTFGEHDRLCQWWATVATEFTSETGHPYSWHSVRRKVELVTKQRIKLLETLRESGEADRAEEGWKKALEMWIPAWERFQEQEVQRSAGKGWRRGRKRKTVEVGLDEEEVGVPQLQQQQAQQPEQQPQVGDVGVQLPSGFDSLFDQQNGQSNSSRASMRKTKNTGGGLGDPALSAALLETLSKLNRNLDSRTSPITALPTTPSQHTPSLDNHNANNLANSSPFGRMAGPAIDELRGELKEELKQEVRQELREEFLHEMRKDRAQMEERIDAVQRTNQMILDLWQQEP